MKAFLSHSSKDKHFVRAVADSLGSALCEYDEYTFDFVLNAQAIRQAFSRCDLFVLFFSANSIRSDFVSEEIRTALDLRAQGQIKKVLIISLDETSYKALPEWMQAINVSTRLTTTKTCARRIETELYVLESEYGKSSDLYQPRDEEVPLRAALSKPPGIAPIAIHVVGHPGIGRRTFLQTVLKAAFPRKIQTIVLVPLNRFEGVNEFYRRLYEYFVVSTVDEAGRDFERFAQMTEPEALAAAEVAIKRTPEFLPVYFLRADICLSLNDTKGARADLKTVNEILDRRGGFSEDDEGRTTELEIKILIEEKQFRQAKDKVNTAMFIPSRVRRRLKRSLARAVSYEQDGVDSATKQWALEIIKNQ